MTIFEIAQKCSNLCTFAEEFIIVFKTYIQRTKDENHIEDTI